MSDFLSRARRTRCRRRSTARRIRRPRASAALTVESVAEARTDGDASRRARAAERTRCALGAAGGACRARGSRPVRRSSARAEHAGERRSSRDECPREPHAASVAPRRAPSAREPDRQPPLPAAPSPLPCPSLRAPIIPRVVDSRLERMQTLSPPSPRTSRRCASTSAGSKSARTSSSRAEVFSSASPSDRRICRSPTTSAAGAAHELAACDRSRERGAAQPPRQRADRRRRAVEPDEDHGRRARHDQARRAGADAVAEPLPLPDEPEPGLANSGLPSFNGNGSRVSARRSR